LDITLCSELNASGTPTSGKEAPQLMRTAVDVHEGHPSRAHLLFEEEVECCRRQLYPAALKMTGNRSDAEDLVQETLTRAYAGLRGYTPGSNARAWLHRIMTNVFANTCRKKNREPVHVLSAELELGQPGCAVRGIGGPMAHTPSAEDEVLGQFAYSRYRQAIDELPDCFKAAIYLADVEGYSYDDVAEMTGVPIGTVTSRLHRARNRLRDRLSARSGSGRH
jgi:RNA polymerase sigma-70 factor, ECF subfamily